MSAVRVRGLLLAAGAGTRFGTQRKLLQPLPEGEAVLARSIARLVQALGATAVHVVVRADDGPEAALARTHGVHVVRSMNASRGMGASLADGARALPDDAPLVVALGDMPAIAAATYAAVRDALCAGASIVQPRCVSRAGHPVGLAARPGHPVGFAARPGHPVGFAARPGHPVGFAARWLDALRALDGDAGARSLLRAHAAQVTALDVDDPGCLRDIDTPDDLRRLRGDDGALVR